MERVCCGARGKLQMTGRAAWRSVAFVMQLVCLRNFRSSQLGAEVVFGLAPRVGECHVVLQKNGEHVCRFRSLVAIAWRLFNKNKCLLEEASTLHESSRLICVNCTVRDV